VNGREVGDGGETSLEDPGLYVDTSQRAVVHCLDDGRDCREGDGAQGNEVLEGAEGNGDDFCIFRCAAHGDRSKGVIYMPAICREGPGHAESKSSRCTIAVLLCVILLPA
jgi:hypothetical protein